MKPLVSLLALLLLVSLPACESRDSKEIAIVQQFSPAMGQWQDVILVYGYWNNYNEADLIAKHYATVNTERQYRVINKKVTRHQYNQLTKTLTQ